MENSFRRCVWALSRLAALVLMILALFHSGNALAAVPTSPVLHVINRLGQDGEATLNSGLAFVTDFKGSNDVTITNLSGSLSSDYTDEFGGAYGFDNPIYLTNFVGVASNGTGDGSVGDLRDLQTSGSDSTQFDFALQFTPQDRLLLIDCDNSEQYSIQAYIKSNGLFAAVSLTNWIATNYAGSTEELPNASFPVWNATTGVLTAGGSGLDEPLTVFTPDQPIDRVVITQIVSGGGTASLQFIHPVPGNLGALTVRPNGASVAITVPTNPVAPALQMSTDLASTNWITIQTNLTGGVLNFPTTTNNQEFFRLKY